MTLLMAALAGCGGSESDQPDQAPTTSPQLQGTIATGYDIDPNVNMLAQGASGPSREISTSPAVGNANALRRYVVSTAELTGPYTLTYRYVDGSGTLTGAATTPNATANVTTLTHLALAQLLAQDPSSVIPSYGISADITASLSAVITDANLAAAQRRVTDDLQDQLGLTLKSESADFFTTTFQAVSGDTMYDTLVDLKTKLAATNLTYQQFVARVAADAGACKTASVTLAYAAKASAFCAASATRVADAADASVDDYTFKTAFGDTLVVQARDQAILSARLTIGLAGAVYLCSGSGCNGMTLGAPESDTSRTLTLASTAFTGDAGTVGLTGTLTTGTSSAVLPTLPCTDNFYTLVYSNGTADGACIDPDNAGLAYGSADIYGQTRGVYRLGLVNVEARDQTVFGVTVQQIDPNDGFTVLATYRCSGSACNDAVIGPTTVDTSYGFDVDIHQMTFNDTVLSLVNADGTLSATDTVTLHLSVLASFAPYQPAFASTPVACASPNPSSVIATFSDDGDPLNLCPPDPTAAVNAGFDIGIATYPYGDGLVDYYVRRLYMGNAGTNYFAGVSVSTDTTGAVTAVNLSNAGGVTYTCTGPACAGVSVSAPDSAGNTTVTFTGTTVTEVPSYGLAADRTAVLTGTFVAPPYVPPADGSAARTRPQVLQPHRATVQRPAVH